MTESEASLRQRFRATLLARAQAVGEQLAGATREAPGTPARREILGELHTLKGEARMLGFSTLARLCHVFEERMREEAPDGEALAAVVDAMLLALSANASDDSADDLLRMALVALDPEAGHDAESHAAPDASPRGASGASAKPNGNEGRDGERPLDGASDAWVQVSSRSLEDLTEALSRLSAELTALGPLLETWAKDRSTLERSDARARAEALRTLVSGALLMVTDLRLTSLDQLFARLAAHGRVLGKQRGKVVEVDASAAGVRVERDVAERLLEPLLHLVNNAVDHGLEPPAERGAKKEAGQLSIRARSDGSSVVVELADDGRGIDPEGLRARARALGRTLSHEESPLDLIFESGFSTRDVADDVSGRGLGLDVVKRRVEALGGGVNIESAPGLGTKFAIRIPAAMTQERVLVVRAGEALLGVPDRLVTSVHGRALAEGETVVLQGGEEVPLRSLSSLLRTSRREPERSLFVLEIGGRKTAIACEEIRGHFEVILRPTSPRLAQVCGVASSALTSEGELVLVLSPQSLRAALRGAADGPVPVFAADAAPIQRPRVLVVDDSVIVRDLLTEILTTAGYQVRGAKNGKEALVELADFEPKVVLSDIEMPEMDGFRLLEAIRARAPHLPVILVTARRSDEDRLRAEALGASAYLEKGRFQSKSVLESVQALLGGAP